MSAASSSPPTRRTLGGTLLCLTAGAIAVGFLLPILWMVLSAFKSQEEIFRYGAPLSWRTFVPVAPTLENFREVFTTAPFARYMLNSTIVATSVTLLGLLVNALAAYAFARLEFPFRRILFLVVLSTLMIPFEMIVVPLYLMVRTLGWINTYQGIIVPLLANPFSIFLLHQFFLGLPTTFEDAAKMDGASWRTIFFRIVLPLSKPALITVGLITFLRAWSAFLWPLIVINSQEKMVIEMGIAPFSSEFAIYWGRIFAASTLASFPLIVIFVCLQRYYIEGVVKSGIKG